MMTISRFSEINSSLVHGPIVFLKSSLRVGLGWVLSFQERVKSSCITGSSLFYLSSLLLKHEHIDVADSYPSKRSCTM